MVVIQRFVMGQVLLILMAWFLVESEGLRPYQFSLWIMFKVWLCRLPYRAYKPSPHFIDSRRHNKTSYRIYSLSFDSQIMIKNMRNHVFFLKTRKTHLTRSFWLFWMVCMTRDLQSPFLGPKMWCSSSHNSHNPKNHHEW